MKVRILIPFKDKDTQRIYKRNEIVEMSVDRINDLIGKGRYINIVEESTNED